MKKSLKCIYALFIIDKHEMMCYTKSKRAFASRYNKAQKMGRDRLLFLRFFFFRSFLKKSENLKNFLKKKSNIYEGF